MGAAARRAQQRHIRGGAKKPLIPFFGLVNCRSAAGQPPGVCTRPS